MALTDSMVRHQGEQFVASAESLLAPLNTALDGLAELAGSVYDEGVDVRVSDFNDVNELVQIRLVELGGLVSGFGFMIAPGSVAEVDLLHIWWHFLDGKPYQQRLNLDPTSPAFYDYSEKEFYVLPEQTKARYAAGPYIDYLGTNKHIVTYCIPVMCHERFVGVAGADIDVQSLQGELIDLLPDDMPLTALVINQRGRVILSNDANWATGSLYRDAEMLGGLRQVGPGASFTSSSDVGWNFRGINWAFVLLGGAQ